MGAFEDVVINAKSAAASVGKEAGRLVDISKLKLNAAELQRDISKKYENLGKMVYDAYKSGTSDNMSFDEHIGCIDELYKRIEEVNERINALSKKSACPKCGFKNDDKAVFCSHCGAKLGEESQNDATTDFSDDSFGSDLPSDEKNPDNNFSGED